MKTPTMKTPTMKTPTMKTILTLLMIMVAITKGQTVEG